MTTGYNDVKDTYTILGQGPAKKKMLKFYHQVKCNMGFKVLK